MSEQSTAARHWRLEAEEDGLVWLHLGVPGTRANVLSGEVLAELDGVLERLESEPPRGLILLSDKAQGFVAGADVREFDRFPDAAAARAAIERAQAVLGRLERLPCPSVALLHGYCLGGGLELALACRYRVAEDDPATRLGFPEVRLGIHPGFGGTLRGIRTLGAPAALAAMLSGRSLSARSAVKAGLVERLAPRRHLRAAARHLVQEAPAPRRPPLWAEWASAAPVRPLLAAYLRRKVAARAPRMHYPAPYALIDLWQRHWGDARAMLAAEAESVSRLLQTDTAANLIRVFNLQERLKSEARSDAFDGRRVHVVGGGIMGGDIAAWCALHGFAVTVEDTNRQALGRVVERADRLFRRRLKDPRRVRAALDRLQPDPAGDGIGRADVAVEAIFEDLEAKRELLARLEARLPAEAVIATNTSSIRLEALGEALQRPERLVGLHFFNPVAKMPLVEVVRGEHTADQAVARAAAFARRLDRLPLVVRSAPGFLVNRVLMPYLLEAVRLVEEGVPASLVDRTAVEFGMPMGPIELADAVGLDICLSVGEIIGRELAVEVPERLRALVQSGRRGVKAGRGFYEYRQGKPIKASPPRGYRLPDEVQDRLVLSLVNEAVACRREGIVADGDLVDAGVVFGTGFAPFRGGPLHFAARRPAQLADRLEALAARHGERFRPDPGWATFDDQTPTPSAAPTARAAED